MQKMRRLFSAFLAWAVLVSMLTIPAGAAGDYELTVLSMQTFPAGTTTYDASAASATSDTGKISAQQDEIVVLTVGFKNNTSSAVGIGAFGVRLSYDKDKLELYPLFGRNAYQLENLFSVAKINFVSR